MFRRCTTASAVREVADLAGRGDVPDQLRARHAAGTADQIGAGDGEGAEEHSGGAEKDGVEMHSEWLLDYYARFKFRFLCDLPVGYKRMTWNAMTVV